MGAFPTPVRILGWRGMGSDQPSRAGTRLPRWLRAGAVAGSAAWGFAEATLFFIVPDVLLGAVGLVAPRRAPAAVSAAVAGALAGSLVLFGWVRGSEPSARETIDAVPAIPARMFDDAAIALEERGGAVMLASAFTGIPYKVWAVEMVAGGWSFASFLAWTLPARGIRFLLIGAGTALVGLMFRRRIAARPWVALAAWGAIWVAIYIEYWRRVGF